VPRLEDGHDHALLPRRERHGVADGQVLQLGHDPVDAVDVEAGQVLQDVVAVEPTAALAHLDQPRPDRGRRGPDRDRAGGLPDGLRHELVAGQLGAQLLLGRAPPQRAAAQREQAADRRRDGRQPQSAARSPEPDRRAPGADQAGGEHQVERERRAERHRRGAERPGGAGPIGDRLGRQRGRWLPDLFRDLCRHVVHLPGGVRLRRRGRPRGRAGALRSAGSAGSRRL
jgi:hypothetical protein